MVPQATCSPARQCWIRAFERATGEKLIPFRNPDRTSWTVKAYTVRVVGAGWSDLVCDCPAGRSGKVCKHAAVTAAAIARGLSPTRPIAPSTPSQIAETEAIRAQVPRELVAAAPLLIPAKGAHELLMECFE